MLCFVVFVCCLLVLFLVCVRPCVRASERVRVRVSYSRALEGEGNVGRDAPLDEFKQNKRFDFNLV